MPPAICEAFPDVAKPSATIESTAARERFYRPELDALRFIAFLSVFWCHAQLPWPDPGEPGVRQLVYRVGEAGRDAGAFGVCLFFLLSAFLITELLMRERDVTGTVHIRAFYGRRILRIWPLYFVSLFCGIGYGIARPEFRLPRTAIVAALLLAGNWAFRVLSKSNNPIAPLWSISVEEQFYLLWPAIAKRGGRELLLKICTVLVAASLLSVFLLSWLGSNRAETIWPNSIVQFQFFALGALAALVLAGKTPAWGMASRIAIFAAGWGAWIGAAGVFHVRGFGEYLSAPKMLGGYELAAVGCILIFLSFLGAAPKWFPGWAVYLGKISYGLYAVHEWSLRISIAIAGSPGWKRMLASSFRLNAIAIDGFALCLTILLAAMSYRFLETPFLRLKRRLTFVESRDV